MRLQETEMPVKIRSHLLRRLLFSLVKAWLMGKHRAKIETELLYITFHASPDMIKDIIALKRHNPSLNCTLLMHDFGHVEKLCHQYLDRVEVFSGEGEFVNFVRNCKAKVVIARRGNPYLVFLTRVLYTGRMIYRPYQFVSRYPLRTYSEDLYFMEKYVMEHVQGVYHCYSQSAIRVLKGEMNFDCSVIVNRSECLTELTPARSLPRFSEEDGQIHIVYAAGISRKKSNTRIVGHSNQLDKWRSLVGQGLHVHIYVAYPRSTDEEYGLKDYFDFASESPYFHIEEALPYDDLLVELTRYDWAFCHFSFDRVPVRPGFEMGGSNGFYTHIQAGNPVICSPSIPLYADIVKKYDIGIVVRDTQMNEVRQRIEKFNPVELQENLVKARSELQVNTKQLSWMIWEA